MIYISYQNEKILKKSKNNKNKLDLSPEQRKALAFFNKMQDPFGYGYKDLTTGGIKRKNLNVVLNKARHNKNYQKLPRLNNNLIIDHCNGLLTHYYVSGRYDNKNKIINDLFLMMINVDVLKSIGDGTIQGGIDFIIYLKNNYFPNLFIETSTSGKGQHGFICFKCPKLKNESNYKYLIRVREYYKSFEQWLKAVANKVKADIEIVELMGEPSVMEYKLYSKNDAIKYNKKVEEDKEIPLSWFDYAEDDEKISLPFNQCGKLAKIPRTFLNRPTEFLNIEVINPGDIDRLIKKTPVIVKEKTIQLGSYGLFTQEQALDLQNPNGKYNSVADYVLNNIDITEYPELLLDQNNKIRHTTGRILHKEFFAYFAMVLERCSIDKDQYMNSGSYLPYNRFKSLWNIGYDAGLTNYAFIPKLYKIIREIFVSLDLIDFISRDYEIPILDDKGNKIEEGYCMRWRGNEKFLAKLESFSLTGEEASPTEKLDLISSEKEQTKELNKDLTINTTIIKSIFSDKCQKPLIKVRPMPLNKVLNNEKWLKYLKKRESTILISDNYTKTIENYMLAV